MDPFGRSGGSVLYWPEKDGGKSDAKITHFSKRPFLGVKDTH